MKKIYTFLFLLLALALGVRAQNQYWTYQSQNSINPTSTVSIVHSNQHVYYFQVDVINSILSMTEIDPITMLPTGVDKFFGAAHGLTLEGGFEDVNGNFVLYGYRDMGNNLWHPFYLIIDQNYNFDIVWHHLTPIGRFVRGCSGYDVNNNPAYLFVMDDGRLFVAEPGNTTNNHLVTQGDGCLYQDISWDNRHGVFIATGSLPIPQSQYSPDFFVEIVKVDLSLIPNPVLSPVFHYTIHDQNALGRGENQTLHAQIDNNHLVVYHDLRKESSDVLWLTLVRNFYSVNPYVINSRHFEIPAHKLFALDMVYDTRNRRINLLTQLIYCYTDAWPLQLSQVNPYTLMGMKTIQIDGGYGINAPCPSEADPNISIYSTTLDMNRLSFNYHNPHGSVLASGVDYSATAILTETYDVSTSTCDYQLPISENSANPVLSSFYSIPSVNSILMHNLSFGFSDDQTSAFILCLDPNAYSNRQAYQSPKTFSVDTLKKSEVTIFDNRWFVCSGFEGETTVCLYDLVGKMVWNTITFNEARNALPQENGLYILVAKDCFGNQVVSKVLIP